MAILYPFANFPMKRTVLTFSTIFVIRYFFKLSLFNYKYMQNGNDLIGVENNPAIV